jgi:putative tricarboxylic transport membrane protein
MKTQRSADIISGCFLVLLGTIVLIAASQIRGGMEERLPPRTLPYIVGGMILACGALLALKARRSAGTEMPIKWPGREAMIRIAISLLAILVYIAVMTPLGFPLSSALYVAFGIWYLNRSAVLTALFSGAITGVFSYFVFIRLLELSLPLGTLFLD